MMNKPNTLLLETSVARVEVVALPNYPLMIEDVGATQLNWHPRQLPQLFHGASHMCDGSFRDQHLPSISQSYRRLLLLGHSVCWDDFLSYLLPLSADPFCPMFTRQSVIDWSL